MKTEGLFYPISLYMKYESAFLKLKELFLTLHHCQMSREILLTFFYEHMY